LEQLDEQFDIRDFVNRDFDATHKAGFYHQMPADDAQV
jgi:hypothetical protein